jgi:hypothetical protein
MARRGVRHVYIMVKVRPSAHWANAVGCVSARGPEGWVGKGREDMELQEVDGCVEGLGGEGKGKKQRTFNFLGAFCAHVLVVQVADLLFLRGGQRRRVAGERICADDDAVGHCVCGGELSSSRGVDLVARGYDSELVWCNERQGADGRCTIAELRWWWFEIDILRSRGGEDWEREVRIGSGRVGGSKWDGRWDLGRGKMGMGWFGLDARGLLHMRVLLHFIPLVACNLLTAHCVSIFICLHNFASIYQALLHSTNPQSLHRKHITSHPR